jgi:hypothetical protein
LRPSQQRSWRRRHAPLDSLSSGSGDILRLSSGGVGSLPSAQPLLDDIPVVSIIHRSPAFPAFLLALAFWPLHWGRFLTCCLSLGSLPLPLALLHTAPPEHKPNPSCPARSTRAFSTSITSLRRSVRRWISSLATAFGQAGRCLSTSPCKALTSQARYAL